MDVHKLARRFLVGAVVLGGIGVVFIGSDERNEQPAGNDVHQRHQPPTHRTDRFVSVDEVTDSMGDVQIRRDEEKEKVQDRPHSFEKPLAERAVAADDMQQIARDTRDSTAELAERQLYALWLSGLGLLALIWTLHETRRTANASVRATDAAVAAAQAYIVARVIERPIERAADDQALRRVLPSHRVIGVITNAGGTPAQEVTVEFQRRWLESGKPGGQLDTVARPLDGVAIGSGAEITFPIGTVYHSRLQEAADAHRPSYVTIRGTYRTTIEPTEKREFCVTADYVRHAPLDVRSGLRHGWRTRQGEYDTAMDRSTEDDGEE